MPSMMSNITTFIGILAVLAAASHDNIVALAASMEATTLTLDQKIWLAILAVFFTLRYLRTIVGAIAYFAYKPKKIAADPTYSHLNATVIIPTTFKNPGELTQCIERVLECEPARVFIISSEANVDLIKDVCKLNDFEHIVNVLGVTKLNKREQMLAAIPLVRTDIIVFADDDVFWQDETFLDRLLAIFENPDVGAGGPRQRVRRDKNPSFWNLLGISYLERRVFNNITTNAIDGSISTLSGRTSAYRTSILQTDGFYHYFRNDTWRGKPLNSDDDKCLTRYVYSNGWKICLQSDPKATLETTVEGDSLYIDQCMRWARAHWRGNWTVIENETYWRSPRYFWGCYVIYFGSFWTPAIVVEGVMAGLLWAALGSTDLIKPAFVALGLWIAFTKNLKMIPHFCRYPQDMKFIPILMAFSYYHGFMNLYAANTMTHTQWGSQDLKALETARATTEEELVPLLEEAMPDEKTLGVEARLEEVLHGPEDLTDPYGYKPTPAPEVDFETMEGTFPDATPPLV